MADVFICDGIRTPFGRYGGALANIRTDDLAASARIRALGGDWTGEVHVYDEGTVAVMADPEGTEFCLLGPPGSVLA